MINKKNIYMKVCFNELRPIFDVLNSKFPYAVIKGEPLSYYAYGEFGKRSPSDIDILVSRENLKSLIEILKSFEFTSQMINRNDEILMISHSHQYAPFCKNTNIAKINVDINIDIFWGELKNKPIKVEEFLLDVVEMEIYNCKVKTLSPLKMLIQIILHHYKEMNSLYHLTKHNCINENMFKDVYFLLKNYRKEIHSKNLYDISVQYKIIPYVYYILYYTNQIFCDEMIENLMLKFKTDEGEKLLNLYGLSEEERKEWKVDFITRLMHDDIYQFIKNDLTKKDIEKIENNKRLFGK
ncbi:MAG: nucleotidyltransferase family protein [Clostridium sp.]